MHVVSMSKAAPCHLVFVFAPQSQAVRMLVPHTHAWQACVRLSRQVDNLCEHGHGDEPLQSLAKAIQELSRLRSPRAQVEQVAVRTRRPFAGRWMLAPAPVHARIMIDANIAAHGVVDNS